MCDPTPLPPRAMTDDEYRARWRACGPIRIRLIEKLGKCRHELGQTLDYAHPYARPEGVCPALLYVLDLYSWRVALGFPSWETDDRGIYRIHCPSKKSTVWEMCRAR